MANVAPLPPVLELLAVCVVVPPTLEELDDGVCLVICSLTASVGGGSRPLLAGSVGALVGLAVG